jgi:hypothetical protein
VPSRLAPLASLLPAAAAALAVLRGSTNLLPLGLYLLSLALGLVWCLGRSSPAEAAADRAATPADPPNRRDALVVHRPDPEKLAAVAARFPEPPWSVFFEGRGENDHTILLDARLARSGAGG